VILLLIKSFFTNFEYSRKLCAGEIQLLDSANNGKEEGSEKESKNCERGLQGHDPQGPGRRGQMEAPDQAIVVFLGYRLDAGKEITELREIVEKLGEAVRDDLDPVYSRLDVSIDSTILRGVLAIAHLVVFGLDSPEAMFFPKIFAKHSYSVHFDSHASIQLLIIRRYVAIDVQEVIWVFPSADDPHKILIEGSIVQG
jgi:hypothetical protein